MFSGEAVHPNDFRIVALHSVSGMGRTEVPHHGAGAIHSAHSARVTDVSLEPVLRYYADDCGAEPKNLSRGTNTATCCRSLSVARSVKLDVA